MPNDFDANNREEKNTEHTARKIGEEPSMPENEMQAQPPAEEAPADEPAAQSAPEEADTQQSVPQETPIDELPEEEPSAEEPAMQTDAAMGAAGSEASQGTFGKNKMEGQTGKKERKKWSTKKIVLVTVLVIVIAAAGVMGYLFLGPKNTLAGDNLQEILDNGTFYDGVRLAGVDLSGMTLDEARPLVEEKADESLKGISIDYKVDEDTFSLTADQLGAKADVDQALQKALLYGREGNFAQRMSAINDAKQKGVEIEMPVTYDQSVILESLKANDDKINVPAQDAGVNFEKISDEGSMTTNSKITLTDEVVGKEVDDEALAETIFTQLGQNNFETVVAETQVTQPKLTKAQLEDRYTMLGTFKTEYGSSAEGRRYNIWKMADIINGVKIEPGETWSINEEAGPRTYSRGWKGAPGISNGEYQEEAGGGICQVSSTLYGSILRAEVKVVDRTHHSWPLTYVDGGLAATISTGAPDFKIQNNYDIPIYIVATCDGSARTIEVSIYGPKFEDGLTRDFTSVKISESYSGGEKVIQDPSMAEGQRRVKQDQHPRRVYEVYKHWYDADGNEVKKEKFSTETYAAFPAIVYVGTAPAATPAPVETPTPEAPTPVPQPDPTPAPVETPTPEAPAEGEAA